MAGLTHKTLFYGIAGALGGSAAWVFVVTVSDAAGSGLVTEIMLGALAGLFIGGFIWSHEAIMGRQVKSAIMRACFGAIAGFIGGAAGAALGNTAFTFLGNFVAKAGGFKASLGVTIAVALGWGLLGAAVGFSGGLITRSRDRMLYGLTGGAIGGVFGGILFNELSATSAWSSLAGLTLLGLCIGICISLVEEVFLSAKLKVIKGRHLGREFPLLNPQNLVGRDDRSDVCLSGAEGVAMQHAVIKKKSGHFAIETDGSGMVVYVNQKMTKNSKLEDGDVIRIGSILLMFSSIRKAAAIVLVAFILGFSSLSQAAGVVDAASARITQFDLSGFPVVKAYVSVLDASGNPVRGLNSSAVSLTENNQTIDIDHMRMAGESGKHEPISMAIVIDRSGSMAGEKIARAKESVLRFISLMEPGDKMAIFTFSDEVTMAEPLTDVQEKLRKAVLDIQVGGHTALYDAIANGVESVVPSSGRKAVIVLTDGIANRGALDINQAIGTASKGYVSAYVIGLGKDVRTGRLERVAQETGGTYFFTPTADGLSEIYDTIAKRIRNEYVITYKTSKRGDYLRNASLALGAGLKAERTYFQPESSLFGNANELPLWAYVVPVLSIAGLFGISFRKLDREYDTGHLSVVRGKGTKQDIDINGAVTIGRDERNTLGLFQDQTIDQQHAQVLQENGRYIIEDKGSATGTFVNKKKVTGKQVLADGDVIDVGKATIVFSEGSMSTQGKAVCPSCGSLKREGAKFCAKCGLKAA